MADPSKFKRINLDAVPEPPEKFWAALIDSVLGRGRRFK